jgi:putative ABC transport system substrate-binding protein
VSWHMQQREQPQGGSGDGGGTPPMTPMRSKIGSAHGERRHLGGRHEATTLALSALGVIVTLVLGILVVPVATEAQQPAKKVHRIGYLTGASAAAESSSVEALRQGLHDLGYVEGQTSSMAYRWADGQVDQLPALAADLVRLPVDVIVARGSLASQAAQRATQTIPIVMVGVGRDPVAAGLVASLARPGGNITGLMNLGVELSAKRLELFKEAVPQLARVAVLWEGTSAGQVETWQEVQAAARRLGLTVQSWEVRGPDDFARVFAAMGQERPDGLWVAGGPVMATYRKQIVDLAAESRLPSAFIWREAVEEGGLMSYSWSYLDDSRRAAVYVDKILKGAKPADLPVEQPVKFELVINLKTAKALGLTIPPVLLFQADEVIQ